MKLKTTKNSLNVAFSFPFVLITPVYFSNLLFVPSEDSDQPGHLHSLVSLCCQHMERVVP